MSAAVNVSPAAVVSTASTRGGLTRARSSPCRDNTAPAAPNVVASMPVHARRLSPYHAASVSLTTIRSARCSTETSTCLAGARLAQKNPEKFVAAFATVSVGTSSWQISASACGTTSDSAVRLRFAPGATTIWLSPDLATAISATPVATSLTTTTLARSTPPSRSRASASSASASLPTQPTMMTSAPSRLAASAWFAPLPPGKRPSSASVTVSPATGRRSAVATMSRLIEPITTTEDIAI